MRLLLIFIASAAVFGAGLFAGPDAATAQSRPAARAPAHPTSPPRPTGPHAIGKFDDWVAATNSEAGQPTCYAFTRVQSSSPAVPGRGEVVLTVTQRMTSRDAVAITAGFAYSPGATVTLSADATPLQVYSAPRSTFARDGHSAVAAFLKAQKVIAKSTGPHNATVTDQFSLRGFNAAYAATLKACPQKSPASTP